MQFRLVELKQLPTRLKSETLRQVKNMGKYWLLFATLSMTIIALAAIVWSLGHPYGTSWDEAEYLNQVQIDVQRLHSWHLLTVGGRIILKSWGRPPAYRILALPVLGLFGFHTAVARLLTLALFGFSGWFVYLATCRIGSRVAGAFAVLVFCLSPQVVSASIWFSTEGTLYLATSAMLYYVFVCWADGSGRRDTWVGLGLAIGLGLLSKASFIVIAVPLLLLWFVLGRWGQVGLPNLTSQRKAGLLALFVAAPWWLLNIRGAVAGTQQARGFVRNSLGPLSPSTLMQWLGTVAQCLLGYGLSILIVLIAISCFLKAIIKKQKILQPVQKAALGACAFAGLPLILVQLSGTNHLLRHITPAVIPLAIAVGVLADKTGWTRPLVPAAICSALLAIQLIVIVSPILSPNRHPVDPGVANGTLPWRVMALRDQWDWSPVENIGRKCGVTTPAIAYLGDGPAFNLPQIEYPWAAHGTSPDVTWLWRYEDGPIDWQRVMNAAANSDLVVTAPRYVDEARESDRLENQHNGEFADRLSRDPAFRGRILLEMGRFQPVEVAVFVKRALVCDSETSTLPRQ